MTELYIMAIVYCFGKVSLPKFLRFKPLTCGFCLSFWISLVLLDSNNYLCLIGNSCLVAIVYSYFEKIIEFGLKKLTIWTLNLGRQ